MSTLGTGPTHPKPSGPPAPPRPRAIQTPARQISTVAAAADGPATFSLPQPPTFQIGPAAFPPVPRCAGKSLADGNPARCGDTDPHAWHHLR